MARFHQSAARKEAACGTASSEKYEHMSGDVVYDIEGAPYIDSLVVVMCDGQTLRRH
jgi:hypothetical protein